MICSTVIECLGHASELAVEIEFDYIPEDPPTWRDRDGHGHPGEPEGADLVGVRVHRWLVGEDLRERDESSVWSQLDELAEIEVERCWERYEAECLAEMA